MVIKRQIGILATALLGAVALLVFASVSWGQPAGSAVDYSPSGSPYVAGELLVTYKAGASNSSLNSVESTSSVEIKDDLPDINTQLLEFPAVKGEAARNIREQILAETKAELERDSSVQSVDYNYLRQFSFIPNDPRFKSQYGLKVSNFPDAWNTVRGKGIKVGVVDSGIARSHPDLRRKIAAQKDVAGNDNRAEDDVGHGTHVAGIIGVRTNNGRGVAAGCPRCQLLVAKVDGAFGGITDANVAQGINWSTNRGAKVINLSLGAPQGSRVLKNAIDRATHRGVVVVAAAGNDDSSVRQYPAAYRNVIAAAATNKRDKRAGFSSFGKWVDVAAPGVDILSTFPGGYRRLDGTSFSSPHVAALAGLLADQGRGRAQIRDRILRTAVDKGRNGRDPFYGSGRINAAAAVRR